MSRPLQALTAHEMAICRDAAWEQMRQRDAREQTREVYESLTYLNNAELVGNRWLMSKGTPITAGEEILLTKGWAWWSQAGQSGHAAQPVSD